jgi:tetratricopeptide (TPR) repeat protein
MEADRTKRNALFIGLAAMGLIAGAGIVTATGVLNPTVAFLLADAKRPIPLDDPDFMYARALEYQRDGQPIFAVAAARRAEMASPTYAPAHRFLAANALKNNDYAEAAQQCRGLLASDPQDPAAQLGLANAYRGMGNDAEAESAYRKVMESQMYDAGVRQTAEQALKSMTGKAAKP